MEPNYTNTFDKIPLAPSPPFSWKKGMTIEINLLILSESNPMIENPSTMPMRLPNLDPPMDDTGTESAYTIRKAAHPLMVQKEGCPVGSKVNLPDLCPGTL